MVASPTSLLATCAATGGGEQSSEADEDGMKSAAGDFEDYNEGYRGGASLDALSFCRQARDTRQMTGQCAVHSWRWRATPCA